jgi:hypothetical protein
MSKVLSLLWLSGNGSIVGSRNPVEILLQFPPTWLESTSSITSAGNVDFLTMATKSDGKQLAEGLALVKKLRDAGLEPKGYHLASSYDRHFWRLHQVQPASPRQPATSWPITA